MGARASYQVGTVDTGETSCLVLPTDRAQITEVPVLLCAGRGATAWQMFADPYTAHFVRPLVDAGHPVLCLSPGGTAAWGGPDAMDVIDAGRAHLADVAGASSAACVIGGFSMGGLAALNYARLNSSDVAACVAFCPAVDLVSLHAANGTYATEIEAVYGGGGWLAGSVDYDPTRNDHPTGVPTKVWYSTDDTAALTATQTAWLAANPAVTGVSLGAVGHSPLTVGDQDVLDFITEALA